MAYTGGPLNELNGKMGISAPFKSVPVMKLIRIHKPKTRDELYELIKFHFENNCLRSLDVISFSINRKNQIPIYYFLF